MNTKEAIKNAFGEERAALYDAEVQNLIEKGYDEKEINAFLETYALPIGVFYGLSMLMRSKISVKDTTKSLVFLFNSPAMTMQELATHLKPNSKILDFGSGRGLVSCSFALKGFEIHGVDVSEDAIAVAKKLAHKLSCRAMFHLIDKNKLPFDDECFDAVLSVWTFHEVQQEQMPKIAAELYRVLHKRGQVFIVDQEQVAPFETLRNTMNQAGFRLQSERILSPVYDHGKTSNAIMLRYSKE